MSHVDRKVREKEAVKTSILAAARAIADKDGWQGVTIRKIADEIEYTPPIVYEHFKNKEDVFHAIMIDGFRGLRDLFDEVRAKETDPKVILMELAHCHMNIAMQNKELFKLMYGLERPTPNEEMEETFKLINDQFLVLSNNDHALAEELMFNWICLQNGFINILFKGLPPHLENIDTREYLTRFITRFLNSI